MCQRCNPAPYCLWCGERVARVLPGQCRDSIQGPVFCTLFCAAQAAYCYAAADGVYWCAECQQWHDDSTGCTHVEPARWELGEVRP